MKYYMHPVGQPISKNNLSGFSLSPAQLYLTSIFTRRGSANLVIVYITVLLVASHVIQNCNCRFKQSIGSTATCKILRYLKF